MVRAKAKKEEAGADMFRLFKYLFYLVVLGFIGLVAYAYVGPFVGVDFSPPQVETRQPVVLDAN